MSSVGAHAVGHLRMEFSYSALGTGAARTLPVEIWYPAEPGPQGPAEYQIAGVVEISDDQALEGATPASGSFPVVLYSHGWGGVGALGYPYADLLASHGWIVVAPDHVGNTTLDAFGGVDFVQVALDRPADITATLDALNVGTLADAVGGSADVDRTVLLGHSFGGYGILAAPGAAIVPAALGCGDGSTAEECVPLTDPVVAAVTAPELDERILAIIPQAPAFVGVFDLSSVQALPMPMLLMSGQRDLTTPDVSNATVAWQARADPEDRWLQVPEGGHYSFITICHDVAPELLEAFLGDVQSDGCGPSFPATTALVPVFASYTLGFAELHGRGDAAFSSLFEGDSMLSEHVLMALP